MKFPLWKVYVGGALLSFSLLIPLLLVPLAERSLVIGIWVSVTVVSGMRLSHMHSTWQYYQRHLARMKEQAGTQPSSLEKRMRVDAPVVGFRAFAYTEPAQLTLPFLKRHRLRSLWLHKPWEPGVNYFSCAFAPKEHDSPIWWCSCGLYAHSHIGMVRNSLSAARAPIVLGAVLGGGVGMQWHPDGWRAPAARIIALANPSPLCPPSPCGYASETEVQLLADAYKVPVLPFEFLEPFALEHGCRAIITQTL